jgi:hypothetical protein
MSRSAKLSALLAAATLTAVVSLAGCGSAPAAHSVRGRLAGQQIATTVDHPLASYYVEQHLAGLASRPHWDAQLQAIDAELGDAPPTAEQLQRWSRLHSPDLAALILAQQLRRHAEGQPLFRIFLEELANGDAAGPIDRRPLFVFVPGWLYRTDSTTGADFAQQRALLAAHGARATLAATDENGSVEANAQMIAALLRKLAETEQQIVLVSASKGGPEVARALTLLRDDSAADHVAAWINIGGLLQGSPLADAALTWPLCWLVNWLILPDGSFDGIRSLAVEASAARWKQVQLPTHLLVVNYLAIPLSGQVSPQARDGYLHLRAAGPNDGLTVLTDAIAPQGLSIPELGVDHYFRAPEIVTRTLALTRAVTRQLRDSPHQAQAGTER